MSDTPEIRPALSVEEWERREFEEDTGLLEHFSAGNDGKVWVSCGYETLASTNRPHALAALCLHGHPAGFTWEDVDRLRAEVYPPGRTPLFELMDLADRIAALLPPREAEGQTAQD